PGRPPKRASLVGLGGRSGGYPPLLKPGAEMDYEAAVKSAPVSEKMAQSAYHAAALGCSPLDPQALGMLGLGGHGAGNSAAAAAAAAAYQRHLLSGGLALPLASIAHLGRGQERLLRQQAAGMDLCNPRWASSRRTTLYGDWPRRRLMNGSRTKQTSTYLYGICERQRFYGSDVRVQKIGLPVLLAEYYNRRCSHLFLSVAETVTTPARKTSHATPTQTASPKVPDVRPPGDAETGSALNLSQNGSGTRARDVDVFRTRDDDDGQGESDYAEDRDQGASTYPKRHRAPSQDGDSQLQQFMDRTGLLAARGSVETLLQNILGLLKVAEENARQQEQQVHMERAELKVEILRERELREGLEKKLQEEQNKRVFYQKRLRREKRCRRQVQDQLEGEVKKRVRYEEALRTTLAES
ncbi:dachshund, putative, partial [Ixodes scapularis]